MHNVWVSGAYNDSEDKPAVGAWMCPTLGLCAITKRSKAESLNDGLRIGCATAILSALNYLGDSMRVYVPKYPDPRWVANPKRAVPLPNLLYRILYKSEVHPRIESSSIVVVPIVDDHYMYQLHALLTKGEVPKGCTL